MRRRSPPTSAPRGARELVERALRWRRRGELRKSLQNLRLACCGYEYDPKLWALYGHQAWLSGKAAEAEEALTRAVWLYERQGDAKRAGAVARILARVHADG